LPIHFIPKSTVHFLNRSIDSNGFTIAFDVDYLEHNNIHRLVNPIGDSSFILNISNLKFNNLVQISKIITNQAKVNEQNYQAKCFLLGLELLLNAIASEKGLNNNIVEGNNDSIQQLFSKLLSENIHQHTDVKWYATQLGISAKSLSNHFIKLGFDSPKKQIVKSLLKSVKKSLINTDRSIKQIAIDHNYTEANLCKLFKNKVGYSMTEYRSDKDDQF